MADIVIKVNPDGATLYHYTEALDLSFLGPLKNVQRVSDVEFDHTTQRWQAIDRVTGRVIATHRARSIVLKAEAAYYGERL